jgi:hypothetical protein
MNPHGLPPKPWLRASNASRALAACLGVHRTAARLGPHVPSWLWSVSRVTRLMATQGIVGPLQLACRSAIGPAVTPDVPELFGVYGDPRTIGWTEAWRTTERLLRRLASRVRADGPAFGVVIVPTSFDVDPRQNPYFDLFPAARRESWDWNYPERRLTAFLDAAQVPVLSLLGPLRDQARTAGRLGYYVWDGHWNPDGHAAVAGAVASFVRTLLAEHERGAR